MQAAFLDVCHATEVKIPSFDCLPCVQVVDYLAHLTIRVYMDLVRKQQGLGLRPKPLGSRLPPGHLAGLITPQLTVAPMSSVTGSFSGNWLQARGQGLATTGNTRVMHTVPRRPLGNKLPVVVVPTLTQLQLEAQERSEEGSTGRGSVRNGVLSNGASHRIRVASTLVKKSGSGVGVGEGGGDGGEDGAQQWAGLSGWAGDEVEEAGLPFQQSMAAGSASGGVHGQEWQRPTVEPAPAVGGEGQAVKWQAEGNNCGEQQRPRAGIPGPAELPSSELSCPMSADGKGPADGQWGANVDKREAPATAPARLRSGRSVRSGKSACMDQEMIGGEFSEISSSAVLEECASWEGM